MNLIIASRPYVTLGDSDPKRSIVELLREIYAIDYPIFSEIDQIFLVNHVTNYITKELLRDQSINEAIYLRRGFGDENKIKLAFNLLKNAEILEHDQVSEGEFYIRVQNDRNAIYFPLYHEVLSSVVKKLPGIELYVEAYNYERVDGKRTKEIGDPGKFFAINDELNKIISMDGGERNWTVSGKNKVEEPGHYLRELTGLSVMKNENNDNLLIMGEDPYYVSYVAAGIPIYDLSDGIPVNIYKQTINASAMTYSIAFINIDRVSLQEQHNLWRILKNQGFEDSKIIIHSRNKDVRLLPEFGKFRKVDYPSLESLKSINMKLFVAYLINGIEHEIKLTWGPILNTDLLKLLPELRSSKEIHSLAWAFRKPFIKKDFRKLFIRGNHYVLSKNCHRFLLYDPEFWYILSEELKVIQKSDKIRAAAKKTKPRYEWLFRGDFWEISFGTNDPILIGDRKGLVYIAHLLANPGRQIKVDDLEEMAFGKNKSVNEDEASDRVEAISKNVKRTIKDIEEKEQMLGTNNALSTYLTNAFFPRHNSPKGSKGIDGNFNTAENYCASIPDPEIVWKISTPRLHQG